MCRGIFQRTLQIGNSQHSLSPLYEEHIVGRNADQSVLWYSIPYEAHKNWKGAIRSVHCIRDKAIRNNSCSECLKLLTAKSFKARVRRMNTGKSLSKHRSNNKYLPAASKIKKLNSLRSQNNTLRLHTHRLAMLLSRTKTRKRKLAVKLSEMAQRGDVSAIIENLNRSYEKGCLNGKSLVLKFMRDITENLRRKANGKRYNEASKNMYEALSIIGGPRSASLIATVIQLLQRPNQRENLTTSHVG